METTGGLEEQSVLDKKSWGGNGMKYIILLDSEVNDEYNNKAEAVLVYHEYVAEEGDYHDFTLCEVMETHEAPELEDKESSNHLHYGIDYNPPKKEDIHSGWMDSMDKLKRM